MTEPGSSTLCSTRAAYDAIAVDYTVRFRDELAGEPLDRALLAAFTELVQSAGAEPVADVGCGPGHVTAHLHSLGSTAFGVDLSEAMVALARRACPALRFDPRSMTALDLPDGALGGIVAWYSIIHLPPERLPVAFAEFHRVLGPGGHLLVAFQVGDERRHLEQWHGRAVSLEFLPVAARAGRRAAERSRVRGARPAGARARPVPRARSTGVPAGSQDGHRPVERAGPPGGQPVSGWPGPGPASHSRGYGMRW